MGSWIWLGPTLSQAGFATARLGHRPACAQAGMCLTPPFGASIWLAPHVGVSSEAALSTPVVGQPQFALQAVGWHRARGRGRRLALAQAAGSWLAQRAWAQDDFSFRCWGTQLWQVVGQRMAWLQVCLVTGRLGHRPAWPQAGLVTSRLGHRLAWSQDLVADQLGTEQTPLRRGACFANRSLG